LAKVAPTVKTSLPAFAAMVFVSWVCSAAERPTPTPTRRDPSDLVQRQARCGDVLLEQNGQPR
jgi:hypothetical protein